MEYKIRQANPADGDKLLALIEAEAAQGDLELVYTRRPNPVLSYQKESDRVSFGIVTNDIGNPCFMEVCITRDYYFHGEATPCVYVCGVRKKAGDQKNVYFMRTALDYETRDKTAGFCSILKANQHAIRVFSGKNKPRRFFPQLSPLCGYTTFLINPKAMAARVDTELTFTPVEAGDLPLVYRFLEQEGKKYELFPVVRDFEAQFSGLRLADCYLLKKDGEMVAFGALWDQKPYRQYIIKHYGGIYKYLSKAAKLVKMLGYINLPPAGDTANILTLTLLTARDGDQKIYRELLSRLAREAIRRGSPTLVAGVSQNNRYYPLFKRLKSVRFDSTLYAMTVAGNQQPLPDATREIHMECGYL